MAGRWRRRGAAVCLALLLPTAATGADDGRVLVFATPPWEQPAGARRRDGLRRLFGRRCGPGRTDPAGGQGAPVASP